MQVTLLSDTHGVFPKLAGGDLLILAGDYTDWGRKEFAVATRSKQVKQDFSGFLTWLEIQAKKYEQVFYIYGNHDLDLPLGFLEEYCRERGIANVQDLNFRVLEYQGMSFYGTPWSVCYNLPGLANAWDWMTINREFDKQFWQEAPAVDCLVSHGPPFGVLDKVNYRESVGSAELLDYLSRTKPQYAVFGHIHEYASQSVQLDLTLCLNVVQRPIYLNFAAKKGKKSDNT